MAFALSHRPVTHSLFIALFFCALLFAGTSADAQWILDGEVVDLDGNPVAGVDIDIIDPTGTELALSGDFTDATGTFSLETLLLSPLVGFYEISLNPPVGTTFEELVFPDVFLVGDTDLGSFLMRREVTFSGQVVDEAGIAIPGIDLEFFDQDGIEVAMNNDDTDLAGFFSVVIPEGTWSVVFRQVTPAAVDYASFLVPEQSIRADLDMGILTMFEAQEVTGSVETEAGVALSGVNLDVFDATTGVEIPVAVDSTDAVGAFSFEAPATDIRIEFYPSTGGSAPAEVAATIEAGIVNDLGVVTLLDASEISGRVVDQVMVGIASVDLDFIDTTTGLPVLSDNDDTDTDGNFLTAIIPGTYDVEVRPTFSSGFAPTTLEGQDLSATTDLGDIVLDAGFALTGLATESGLPVADVEVTLVHTSDGSTVTTFGNSTGEDGAYAIRVAEGTYDVTYTPPAATGLTAITMLSLEVLADTVVDVAFGEVTPPVTTLTCEVVIDSVNLEWVNGSLEYDAVAVTRDGTPLATLAGDATTYVDAGVPVGLHTYAVVASITGIASEEVVHEAEIFAPPSAVTDLTCVVTDAEVALAWTNVDADYETLTVRRDGLDLETLAGTATEYLDVGVAAGEHSYEVIATRNALDTSAPECLAEVLAVVAPPIDLVCSVDVDDITLTWTNGELDYDAVEVRRDGTLIDTLAGDAAAYTDLDVVGPTVTYDVRGIRDSIPSPDATCVAEIEAPSAPIDLVCSVIFDDITLSWANGESDYDAVEVRRDGALIDTLAGDATEYTDVDVVGPMVTYDVRGVRAALASLDASCDAEVVEPEFLRGDTSGNGSLVALLDAQFLLQWGFSNGPEPPCLDAADVDDNGINSPLLDALILLEYAFSNQAPPPDPGPTECGPDPTADALSCETPPDICN